jgi:hypothetical protein
LAKPFEENKIELAGKIEKTDTRSHPVMAKNRSRRPRL